MSRDARVARMPNTDGRTLSSILSLAAGAGALAAAGQAHADSIATEYFAEMPVVGFGVGQSTSWSHALVDTPFKIHLGTSTNALHHRIKVSAEFTGAGTASLAQVWFGTQSSTRNNGISTTRGGQSVAFRTGAGSHLWATTPNWSDNGGALRSNVVGNAFIVASYRAKKSLRPESQHPPYYNYSFQPEGQGGDANTSYLLFRFQDRNVSDTFYYGWIQLLDVTRNPGDPTGMSVTIGGWAYRTTGDLIGAGQTLDAAPVPEIDPASAAGALALAAGALSLLEQRRLRGAGEAMGGALVSGAAGLRRWRKERTAAARGAGPAT